MINIKEESFSECLEEIIPLSKEHYKEVSVYQDKLKLDPNYEAYKELEKVGRLVLVTARDEDKLIGYVLYTISLHLHFQEHLIAVNTLIYLSKEYRGGTIAFDMLAEMEECLKDRNVSVITMNMNIKAPFGTLMKSLDYDKIEYVYSKYIGE